MKKAIKIIFKSILIFLVAVFLLLLIIPTFFKDTIKDKVVEKANSSIEATLSFDDFSLSLIRNFPNLSFRLEEVEIVGLDSFEGEILAGFKSFAFVFDLSSLFSKDGYKLKSLILDRPRANAIILEDGTANWDIVKIATDKEIVDDVVELEDMEEKDSEKELKVMLEQIEIRKAAISYTDYSSGMSASFGSLDLKISGAFAESLTDLIIDLLIEDISLYMDGDRYINRAVMKASFDIVADLENKAFTFNNNSFALNDLILYLDGDVVMKDDDITTNLKFATGETAFKSLLSMVPAFYMNDFKALETEGSIKLDVGVAGTYNSIEAKMPDIDLSLAVNDASVWFKGEAELMSDLNILTDLDVRGEDIVAKMDVNVKKLDLGAVANMMPSDTLEEVKDTVSADMELLVIPSNIDFELSALIEHLIFDSLDARSIKSHILVRDSKLVVDDTGLETLGGIISLQALYNTEDNLNPFMNASFTAENIGIKDSYESFNTVKKLAPVAEGMDGSASVLFEFESILQQDMMPDLNSINGLGRLQSEEIELIDSDLYNKFSSVLNMNDKFSNTLKDVDLEFRVENGRVYFNDFETDLGNIGLTIGGDHGLDQTLNYLVSTAIPASDMPSSLNTLVSGLAVQAALFGLEYTPPEVYNINVGIEGTVKDPKFKPSLGEAGKSVGASAKEAVKEVVKEKVEEVKETVKQEVSKQADKLIEEAEKQAETVKSEAARAAQLIRDEAAVNAQKLIDEASSKGPLAKIAAKKAADVLKSEANKKALKLEEEAAVRADKIVVEARKKAEELG